MKDPFFVELEKDLSVEDRVLIDDFMDGHSYRLISWSRDPTEEH